MQQQRHRLLDISNLFIALEQTACFKSPIYQALFSHSSMFVDLHPRYRMELVRSFNYIIKLEMASLSYEDAEITSPCNDTGRAGPHKVLSRTSFDFQNKEKQESIARLFILFSKRKIILRPLSALLHICHITLKEIALPETPNDKVLHMKLSSFYVQRKKRLENAIKFLKPDLTPIRTSSFTQFYKGAQNCLDDIIMSLPKEWRHGTPPHAACQTGIVNQDFYNL